MIGWTVVEPADLPPGGPLRVGSEARLPPPNAAVATIVFRIAAAAAPLTVDRASRIARLDPDEAADFLDQMVMEGELIRDIDGRRYIGCPR